ncbi:MAG: hypothetical protein JRJ39_00570 [Deltaproteobacteria bacterium]|nr:hypothetical protein [Deltaproteobacteria bacterium]MBW1845603.1 hypothetical protein [Deltaproteobacteria bacterium]MBW2032030.1 hypothetical protein [Deltaproteobacteria bacterium]
MSWLTAIKNFALGAPQITTDIFDKNDGLLVKVGGFFNGLHLSESEKLEHNIKMGQGVTEFVKATLGENTEKSKARRELAVLWIKVQLHLVLINVICVPLAVLFPEQGKPMFDMMLQITLSWLMVGGTVSVMAYFFGTYGWGTYVSGKKKKS